MQMQYTDEEWRTFISDQKASDLTITKYCRYYVLSNKDVLESIMPWTDLLKEFLDERRSCKYDLFVV